MQVLLDSKVGVRTGTALCTGPGLSTTVDVRIGDVPKGYLWKVENGPDRLTPYVLVFGRKPSELLLMIAFSFLLCVPLSRIVFGHARWL